MNIQFKNQEDLACWRGTDDIVMGGISNSGFCLSDRQTLVFRGNVSLENGGGFSSVRYDASPGQFANTKGLGIRVRGDGKRYKLYAKNGHHAGGLNYQNSFDTLKGEWQTLIFEFSSLKPVIKGRPVEGSPELAPEQIVSVGFIISGKQEGAFKLEIESIEALPTDV